MQIIFILSWHQISYLKSSANFVITKWIIDIVDFVIDDRKYIDIWHTDHRCEYSPTNYDFEEIWNSGIIILKNQLFHKIQIFCRLNSHWIHPVEKLSYYNDIKYHFSSYVIYNQSKKFNIMVKLTILLWLWFWPKGK